MPKKKKQHYVPRFYLRNFSLNKKHINIYNLTNEKIIISGNLKNQCYEPYFYGRDGEIEEALSQTETHASSLIKNIIVGKRAPTRFSEEHVLLVLFILMQIGRTKAAADDENYITDALFKEIYKDHSKL